MTPTKSCLICANQRSGTTLLSRALAATGVAGRPEEYFLAVDEVAQPGWKLWEEGPYAAGKPLDREQYLDLVRDYGTTPNGIFGAKLMWNSVAWALAKFRELPRFEGLSTLDVFRTAFPDLHAVFVVRRDRVRQAVSWARAAQDGVWVVSDVEPAQPVLDPKYDDELIGNLVGLIEVGEVGWRALFAELELEPYEVVYEDFVTDDGYERTIRGIVSLLGEDASAISIPPRPTHRQADAINDEWEARFRSASSSA